MTRILLRAGKDPRLSMTHEQSLAVSGVAVFGANSGNMLFYSSLHRALSVPQNEVITDGYVFERSDQSPVRAAARVNGVYDHYVLPLANSFRQTFIPHMARLTKMIERLTVPVSVAGVGAQMPYGATFDNIDQGLANATKAFVAAVLDRSPSIGVRGEYTAEMLMHLGFPEDQIDIIGCPSFFLHGRPQAMSKRVDRLSTTGSGLSLSYTPEVPGIAEFLEHNTARFPASVVVPQTHTALALMLWGERHPEASVGRFPTHPDHPLYLQDRLRHFVDARTWIDYLRNFEFVTGTRIHGNAAGVLAGTPSLVLAHDSRTAELADYHGVPWRTFAEFGADGDLHRLYEDLDLSVYERRADSTFTTYTEFLDRHGLDHVFREGYENPDYDKQIRDAPFPGPVHTLMAQDPIGRRQVIDRLSWLRQSHKGDQGRPAYAIKLPMGGARLTPASASADSVRKLDERLVEVTKTQRRLQGELQRLRESEITQSAELKRMRRTLSIVTLGPVGRFVWRSIRKFRSSPSESSDVSGEYFGAR